VPEQYENEWRHEGNPREDEARARGRDAAHQAKDDGYQNPCRRKGGFRIFELHDAILHRTGRGRCSEVHTPGLRVLSHSCGYTEPGPGEAGEGDEGWHDRF
jgi:hypothetical protein